MNSALLDTDPSGNQARRQHTGRIRLEGSLAIYDVGEAKPQLIDAVAANRQLEIDLSRVDAIDAAGIQLLMLAKVHAAALGHELNLVGHSPAVAEMFELFRLAGYFGDPILLPEGALGSKAS